MSDLAVFFGERISEFHLAHVIASTKQQPRALTMITGAPTVDKALVGKGTGTLYLCAHAPRRRWAVWTHLTF